MPALRATALRHVQPVVPLRFPSEEPLDEHAKGADQFVYYDAANPRRCLAPDALFETWKTWESGAPHVAFEVLSPSDTPERWSFREKLKRYRALGVRELIFANLDAPPGKRLRAWDRLDEDLVERVVENDSTPCVTLGVHVLIGRVERYPVGVRVARDAAGYDPVLTPSEGEKAAKVREDAANARIAEPEKALAKKRRQK